MPGEGPRQCETVRRESRTNLLAGLEGDEGSGKAALWIFEQRGNSHVPICFFS